MARFRKSTIKEVALRAGVSSATVSYFVNGRSNVCSPETADRIRKAVEELQYTASSLGAGMRTSIRHALGACLSSPFDSDVTFGAFFFERIWKGISHQADIEDYAIHRYPRSVRLSDSCDAFLDGKADGIIYHALAEDNTRPAKLAQAGMPVVLLTRSRNIPAGCSSVYTDEKFVVDFALDRLYELGHRRIAHIAGPVEKIITNVDDIAIERLEAYKLWMKQHHLVDYMLSDTTLAWHNFDVEQTVSEWYRLTDRPTAILCANDSMALSTVSVARSIGWQVPKQLSVVGIDNSNDPNLIQSPVTTIDPNVYKLGTEAVACLIKIMNSTVSEDMHISLKSAEWIDRHTAAKPSNID